LRHQRTLHSFAPSLQHKSPSTKATSIVLCNSLTHITVANFDSLYHIRYDIVVVPICQQLF
ncbi:MAG: hypothetical protein ACYSR9_13105, partial [Planctomycetota bacterium]